MSLSTLQSITANHLIFPYDHMAARALDWSVNSLTLQMAGMRGICMHHTHETSIWQRTISCVCLPKTSGAYPPELLVLACGHAL